MPSYFAPLSSLSFNVISQLSGKAYSFKQSSPILVTSQKDVEWLRNHTALYECKADGTPMDPRRGPMSTVRPEPMTSVSLVPTKPLSVTKFAPEPVEEPTVEEAAPVKKKKTSKKTTGKKRGRPKKKK